MFIKLTPVKPTWIEDKEIFMIPENPREPFGRLKEAHQVKLNLYEEHQIVVNTDHIVYITTEQFSHENIFPNKPDIIGEVTYISLRGREGNGIYVKETYDELKTFIMKILNDL